MESRGQSRKEEGSGEDMEQKGDKPMKDELIRKGRKEGKVTMDG